MATGTGFGAVFASRRMAVLFALGFASGLPLFLTGATLAAWLTTARLTATEVATFASIGLAYTFKFLWAPLLDRYRLPWLGRRRGWMLALQLGLIVAIAALGTSEPRAASFRWLAIAVAVLSASQDVVLDAYNADLLAPAERAAGAGVYVMGYRVALLVTGSAALVLADHASWTVVYGACAGLMGVGVVATLLAEEPAGQAPPRELADALVVPFTELFTRLGGRAAATALAFAALYRFGDQFAQPLLMTFFQRGAEFTLTEIGTLNKALGFGGTLVGAALGGVLVARHGLPRMLVIFGVAQAATNLLYLWVAVDHRYVAFGSAVFVDNVANAMGTGAFVAYLMSMCSPAVSATQFALFTSLSSVGQRVFGPLGGPVQEAVGWPGFFVVTTALALPGLALAWWMARGAARAGDQSSASSTDADRSSDAARS